MEFLQKLGTVWTMDFPFNNTDKNATRHHRGRVIALICLLASLAQAYEGAQFAETSSTYYNNPYVNAEPVRISFFHSMNMLKQALASVESEDSVLMGASSVVGESSQVNKGDLAYLPYQASDIVEYKILGSKDGLPNNPNQQPKFVNPGLLDHLVDPETGKFHQDLCHQSSGLMGWQPNKCLEYLNLMPAVVKGFAMGLNQCENQFAHERWNCQGHNITLHENRNRRARRNPNQMRKVQRTYMDWLIARSSREAGYVLAITSASVVYSITKACSSKQFPEDCGCDESEVIFKNGFYAPSYQALGLDNQMVHDKAAICSDNVKFGVAVSRNFLDNSLRTRLMRQANVTMALLHNIHVGRKAVEKSIVDRCMCNDLENPCRKQICWRSLPDFKVIADTIKEQYDRSQLVEYYSNNNKLYIKPEPVPQNYEMRYARGTLNIYPRRNPTLLRTARQPSTPTDDQMVHLTESPDFCHHQWIQGSLGTMGRVCQLSKDGPSNCNNLCCGRGYIEQRLEVTRKCKCKFIWCCEVKCELCTEHVSIYRCR